MMQLLLVLLTPISPLQELRPLPRFEKAVGHFDHFTSFHKFILANEGKEVWFDVQIADFDGSTGEDVFFTLWLSCEELDPCESPSVMKCEGWSFNLVEMKPGQKSGLHKEAGWMVLRGRFRINGISGPHQGLMACGLTPMN